ncbi:hypothetical protein KKE60_08230 [Patescibacteria group bacterium]|nr:hypothetical protein [Patescibacteria group bacterium]
MDFKACRKLGGLYVPKERACAVRLEKRPQRGDRLTTRKSIWTKKMGPKEWIDLPMVTVPVSRLGTVTYTDIQGEFHVMWDPPLNFETIELYNSDAWEDFDVLVK